MNVEFAIGEEALEVLKHSSSFLIIGNGRLCFEIARNLKLDGVARVDISEHAVAREKLSLYHCVCVCDNSKSMEDLVEINQSCRELGVKFVLAECYGVIGVVFSDFGRSHSVINSKGQAAKTVSVDRGTMQLQAGVLCFQSRSILRDDEASARYVMKGFSGPNSDLLNGKECTLSQKNDIIVVSLEGLKSLDGLKCGYFEEIVEKDMTFESLNDSISDPELVMTNLAEFEHHSMYHTIWKALKVYQTKNKKMPITVEQLKDLIPEKKISDDVVKCFLKDTVFEVVGHFAGMTAFEMMKCCGVFEPLNQWYYAKLLDEDTKTVR